MYIFGNNLIEEPEGDKNIFGLSYTKTTIRIKTKQSWATHNNSFGTCILG